MIRGIQAAVVLLLISLQAQAQQFGLFRTGTLFDGFENPAQKTFVLDSSRRFASNFFLPNLGIDIKNSGNDVFFRTLINTGTYDTSQLPLGTGETSTGQQQSNIYLATLKIFQSYKHHKEIGLSWQLKTEGQIRYTNETLAILEHYKRLTNSGITDFDNAFNNQGYLQSYHQFSLSYRENYDKRLAFGAKLSLLSGISYNKLHITESSFSGVNDSDVINVGFHGSYRASFLDWDELEKKTLLPLFKNPGAAISFGTSYTTKRGLFLMGNIKDLGFIRWSRQAVKANFKVLFPIDPVEKSQTVENRITDIVKNNNSRTRHYSAINAKADFMLSKTYSTPLYNVTYTPSVIVSKNLFYRGGNAVLVNKFDYNNLSLSLIPGYDFQNIASFGVQAMYKTANMEIFAGSDNFFRSASDIPGAIKATLNTNDGPINASFYFGIGFKFGRVVEHPQNSSTMPGIN